MESRPSRHFQSRKKGKYIHEIKTTGGQATIYTCTEGAQLVPHGTALIDDRESVEPFAFTGYLILCQI